MATAAATPASSSYSASQPFFVRLAWILALMIVFDHWLHVDGWMAKYNFNQHFQRSNGSARPSCVPAVWSRRCHADGSSASQT